MKAIVVWGVAMLAISVYPPSVERTLSHDDPMGRRLVVYPIVEWQWAYEFKDLTPATLPARQTHAGFTVEIVRTGPNAEPGQPGQFQVTYQVLQDRDRAATDLRLGPPDLIVGGKAWPWSGGGMRTTGGIATSGHWSFEMEAPPSFTLRVPAHEAIGPVELAALVAQHGPLIPGEVSYATAKNTAEEVMGRLQEQRYALSASQPPTCVSLFAYPAYQFGVEGGLPRVSVQLHRLTGEVLAVWGNQMRNRPLESAGGRRALDYLSRIWPELPLDRLQPGDPPDDIAYWQNNDKSHPARKYNWFLPSTTNAQDCDHFEVTLNPGGDLDSAFRLVDVTSPVPTVSVDAATLAARQFLNQHGFVGANYTISERGRSYRTPYVTWPRNESHPAVAGLPQWRFVRALECAPTDTKLAPHYLFVDAHTGEVIDWYRLPPGTPLPLQLP